ncbi:hypothetical protein [Streptomyces sp. KL116D]|uniref:hypothetical protein n=1 Tax=Streptomyces sp. KL116D TaxID=3045152 RepID=UPI003556F97E
MEQSYQLKPGSATVIASSSRPSCSRLEGEPGPVPDPVVSGDGVTHHRLGLCSPAAVAEGIGEDVQDGVCVLSGCQLAQVVELTVA